VSVIYPQKEFRDLLEFTAQSTGLSEIFTLPAASEVYAIILNGTVLSSSEYSQVDVNLTVTPLAEIVTGDKIGVIQRNV
jgi:hypothetical protein